MFPDQISHKQIRFKNLTCPSHLTILYSCQSFVLFVDNSLFSQSLMVIRFCHFVSILFGWTNFCAEYVSVFRIAFSDLSKGGDSLVEEFISSLPSSDNCWPSITLITRNGAMTSQLELASCHVCAIATRTRAHSFSICLFLSEMLNSSGIN